MVKITALPLAGPLSGAEFLPIVQGDDTKRLTMADFRDLITPYLQNWYKGDTGPAGPAGPVWVTLSDFTAAPVSNRKQALQAPGIPPGDFYWETARAPYTPDGVSIIAADDVSPTIGAWVRQRLSGLLGGEAFIMADEGLQIATPKLLLGGSSGHARLVLYTQRTDDLNGADFYFYSNQTSPDNQRFLIGGHVYAHAYGMVMDIVGNKTSILARQAHNSVARSDMPADYIGEGAFYEWQRARPFGGGNHPEGNIGSNLDRLGWINRYGNLCFYGSDAADWDGTDDKAPIQIGTYTHFLQRKGTIGYRDGIGLEIGSIDLDARAFTPIILKASIWLPQGDLTTKIGGLGFRLASIAAQQFRPGSGKPLWTTVEQHPEGNTVAEPGSFVTNEATGQGFLKLTGTDAQGWKQILLAA
ncbi:hypothetical protein [Sphingomonas melonis]|uniref:hypothetical protein n=1 Tax=Sphingomonas melonis TaxID=152682 RepID=UPI000BE3517A|nr:hypothetical protein [Sphingomonas melonis]ATI54501.1 hypothetical protein CP552_01900 [Sphingomonas melonis]